MVESSGGDGISLTGTAATDITNVAFDDLNRTSGSAALKIANPLGNVRVSKVAIQANRVGGILVQSTNEGPLRDESIFPVQCSEVSMFGVHNPFKVDCSAGALEVSLNNCPNLTGLTGTMLGGDVSGSATVIASFDRINLRGIGDQTRALDWVYRNLARGSVRFGQTTPDTTESDTIPNNPLTFTTRDSAQAAFVSKGTRLYPGKNRLDITSRDRSQLQLRYEDYSWYKNSSGDQDHPFSVNIKTLDFSIMESHVSQARRYGYNASFRFDLDRGAIHQVENFYSWLNWAKPISAQFWGWSNRRYVDILTVSLLDYPNPYGGVPNGTLHIPEF